MEKKKILYLDDNDKITRDGDVELMNTISKRILINTDYPCSWAQRAKQIINDLSNLNGIILDWELTNKSEVAKSGSTEAMDVDFSAESLAEHIRTNVNQQGLKDIPIILCSADNNKAFSTKWTKDLSSQNLFDLTFIKSKLFVDEVEDAEAKIFDLISAYEFLQEAKLPIYEYLGLSEAEISQIDIRFVENLGSIIKNNTAHDAVNFLLKYFVQHEGLLITEEILSARLGVDIKSSEKEWDKIMSILISDGLGYFGILSLGWKNFWAYKLNTWWDENFTSIQLESIGASHRVQLLNDKFGLKLKPSEKIKFCISDEFWTICIGTKKPLDPIDGFRISEGIQSPWLDLRYVSGFAELEKEATDSWKIDVLDRERFNQFKSIITAKNG